VSLLMCRMDRVRRSMPPVILAVLVAVTSVPDSPLLQMPLDLFRGPVRICLDHAYF
jgi:hypothetical protein